MVCGPGVLRKLASAVRVCVIAKGQAGPFQVHWSEEAKRKRGLRRSAVVAPNLPSKPWGSKS